MKLKKINDRSQKRYGKGRKHYWKFVIIYKKFHVGFVDVRWKTSRIWMGHLKLQVVVVHHPRQNKKTANG